MRICLAWIRVADSRIDEAQSQMLRGLLRHGHLPVIFAAAAGPRPMLSEMLLETRALARQTNAPHFGWINSDCVPMANFGEAEILAGFGVCGIHRQESESGARGQGVDGYIFDSAAWDKYYAPDVPQMFVGASHVDWWLTRLAEKHGIYKQVTALYHYSHARTPASLGADDYGRFNIQSFRAWARRNQIPEG